jgi:hypothetical protein
MDIDCKNIPDTDLHSQAASPAKSSLMTPVHLPVHDHYTYRSSYFLLQSRQLKCSTILYMFSGNLKK